MSSFDRLWSAELIASTEPCTSAFTSTGNSITTTDQQNMVSKLVGASAVASRSPWSGGTPHLAGALFVLDHGERVACIGHAAKAQDLDRHGRPGFLDLLALIVDDRTDAAALRADHERIATFQSAARDQHGRDRAAALVELRLDHGGVRVTIRIGCQFKQFGLEIDRLQEFVGPVFSGGDFDILRVARHLSR